MAAPLPERPAVRAERFEDGRVLRLVLDRAPANVLDSAMMDGLSGEIAAAREDRHLKLVVLQGAGSHFSYGASVEEHRREQAPEMLARFHALTRALASCPVPVAALVEGRCLGGAFEVVLACHFVFATPSARFGCPEVRLGVFPPVLAALGPLRLGGALAERLVLTGATVGPEALEGAGALTGRLGEAPFDGLLAWYREHLAPLSAAALRHACRASRLGSGALEALGRRLDEVEALYLQEVLPSHDGNEGIAAFLERRPPKWEDS